MERRKRQDDPEMSDHRPERTIDWKTASPRWLLLALLSASTTLGMFSSSIAWSLYRMHEEDQERRYQDWKGGEIAKHAERITWLERRQKDQDEDLVRLDAEAKLARLQTQMEHVSRQVDVLTGEVRKALKDGGS